MISSSPFSAPSVSDRGRGNISGTVMDTSDLLLPHGEPAEEGAERRSCHRTRDAQEKHDPRPPAVKHDREQCRHRYTEPEAAEATDRGPFENRWEWRLGGDDLPGALICGTVFLLHIV